jgi:nitrogen fixation NifU-like protein
VPMKMLKGVTVYSEAVMEHFRNPRNVGDMEDADVILRVGDQECGDMLLLFLKIDNGVVTNVKYRILGCGAAIATSSIASELALGKTLDDLAGCPRRRSIVRSWR